jgi:hypothetical protein
LRARAHQHFKLYRRRKNILSELQVNAPKDAVVEVHIEDPELVAAITLPAQVLSRGASDGWQLLTNWQQHGRVLEFAGSKRPWKEHLSVALRGYPGYADLSTQPTQPKQTTLMLEMAFPAGDDRFYIIGFDGILVMLVIAKDNSVQVELIDGEVLDEVDEVRASRAFTKALSGALAPSRAFVIPDAPHRLTIEVAATGTSLATVKVSFEGRELLRKVHPCRRSAVPDFVVHPFQELHVLRATVNAVFTRSGR